jgi:hypothetical protein
VNLTKIEGLRNGLRPMSRSNGVPAKVDGRGKQSRPNNEEKGDSRPGADLQLPNLHRGLLNGVSLPRRDTHSVGPDPFKRTAPEVAGQLGASTRTVVNLRMAAREVGHGGRNAP